MKPAPFDYARPANLKDAVRALTEAGETGAVLAGGQSLLPLLRLRMGQAKLLVDIGGLAELRSTKESRECVTIGAATTHAQIEDGRVCDPGLGLMQEMAQHIAYRSVRNFGTIGGSVAMADPAADWPVCLMALDASAIIVGALGDRREAVADLIEDTFSTTLVRDEIIVALEIPRLSAGAKTGVAKVVRKAGAFAMSLAVAIVDDKKQGSRVFLGGAGGRAFRLERASERLHERESPDGALKDAILHDLHSHLPDLDAYLTRLHAATALRAIAKARAQ